MRQICEIIADAKEGKVPTHEECFWTMLALSGKLHFVTRDLEAIGETLDKKKSLELTAAIRVGSQEKVLKDKFDFLKKDPVLWLGNSGNPFTEEYKAWYEMGKNIIEKATGEKL